MARKITVGGSSESTPQGVGRTNVPVVSDGETTKLKYAEVALPAEAGEANHAVISKGDGDTEYSFHSLPTEDGRVRAPVVTDGSGALNMLGYGFPASASLAGRILQSNGTDMVMSPFKLPTVVPQAGQLLQSNGTDVKASPFKLPLNTPAAGTLLQSDGTDVKATPFKMPTSMGGSAKKVLTSDGTNLYFDGDIDKLNDSIPGLVAPEGKGIWGAIYTHSDRNNSYSVAWSTSGPHTTYQHALVSSNATSHVQFMNIMTGDGMGANGSTHNFIGDSNDGEVRKLVFSNGNRLGMIRETLHYSNNSSYAGIAGMIIPVRNPTNSPITSSLGYYLTSYGNGEYDGCFVGMVAPNSSVYSATSGQTLSNLFNFTSNGERSGSVTFTVPANTTVLIIAGSSDYYGTTYRFWNRCVIHNLQTLTNAGLECDMRVLSALAKSRLHMSYNSIQDYKIWNKAASDFGGNR